MRIERSGPVELLTPRIERFLREELRGASLDEIQSAERTRIDYVCLGGLVAIEVKTLEGDPAERMNNFIDSLRDRSDFPSFFGPVPLEAVIRNMQEPEALSHRAMDRLGRTIVTHMKKAEDQFREHSKDFARRNCLRLLILVNEDHPEYDPSSIGWTVERELSREADGVPRYKSIDAVVYFTERHGKVIDGRVVLPVLTIHGPNIDLQPWKELVIDHVVGAWSRYQGRSMHPTPGEDVAFSTIEHLPDQMPRHERWRLAYRRKPYLRHISDERLRDAFDEVMLITTLWGIKGSPVKLSMDAAMAAMKRFSHIQIEMHERALPMDRFDHRSERQLAAAVRLKMPPAVLKWLSELNPARGRDPDA